MHPDNERFAAIEGKLCGLAHRLSGTPLTRYRPDWNISANPSDLLHEFQSFHPDLIATMKYVIETPIPSPQLCLTNKQKSYRRQALEAALPSPTTNLASRAFAADWRRRPSHASE